MKAVKLKQDGPAEYRRSDGISATQASPVVVVEDEVADGLVATGRFEGPFDEGDEELEAYEVNWDTGEAENPAPEAAGATDEQREWVMGDDTLTVDELDSELESLDDDYERGDDEYVAILRDLDELERSNRARAGALDAIRDRLPGFDNPVEDPGTEE